MDPFPALFPLGQNHRFYGFVEIPTRVNLTPKSDTFAGFTARLHHLRNQLAEVAEPTEKQKVLSTELRLAGCIQLQNMSELFFAKAGMQPNRVRAGPQPTAIAGQALSAKE